MTVISISPTLTVSPTEKSLSIGSAFEFPDCGGADEPEPDCWVSLSWFAGGVTLSGVLPPELLEAIARKTKQDTTRVVISELSFFL